MADEPTTDENEDMFFAPPETAQKILHALQNAEDDDVSGYSMIDLGRFTYQPIEPKVDRIEGLRAKDMSGTQMLDNCSTWPIGGF